MRVLESLVQTLALFSSGFVVVVNVRQYLATKKWLDSHGVDPSFYENDIKNLKTKSSLEFMRYYLGYFGRKLAYKMHSKV